MDAKHIQGMIHALKPVLKDRDRAPILLEKYWAGKIALVWTVDDVYRAANEIGFAVSRAEAIKLLQDLHQAHNRQFGLKWGDLTEYTRENVLGRELTKREVKQFIERDIITVQR